MYHFKILPNLHGETNMLLPKMVLFPRKKQRKLTEHFQLSQSEIFFKKTGFSKGKFVLVWGGFFRNDGVFFRRSFFFKNCKIRWFHLHKTPGQLFFVLPSQKIHLRRGSDEEKISTRKPRLFRFQNHKKIFFWSQIQGSDSLTI